MIRLIFAVSILVSVLLTVATVYGQKVKSLPKQIKVNGKVNFALPEGQVNKVWLSRDNGTGKPELVDSTVLRPDLTYSFTIKQDHPGVYKLSVLRWDNISFWSDEDVTVVSRGYDTAKMKMKIPHFYYVKGSRDNDFINQTELNNTRSYLRMVDDSNEEYYAKKYAAEKGDSAWSTYLKTRKRYNSQAEDNEERQKLLLEMYKDRPVLIYALRGMSGGRDEEKTKSALAQLDRLMANYPWLTEAVELKNTIQKNKAQAMKLMPGQPVPPISYPDDKGNKQSLEQFKGKYVLIDFWASWCGPCRQAIPKVQSLYDKNKAKGFDVVSVSIDTDTNAWKKAMAEEKMAWMQLLSDNKEKTMEQFQFSGIPTLYLIDPNGNIVTKYTGFGADTESQIQHILDKGIKGQPDQRKSIPMSGF